MNNEHGEALLKVARSGAHATIRTADGSQLSGRIQWRMAQGDPRGAPVLINGRGQLLAVTAANLVRVQS